LFLSGEEKKEERKKKEKKQKPQDPGTQAILRRGIRG
jgi:hypothetical protein